MLENGPPKIMKLKQKERSAIQRELESLAKTPGGLTPQKVVAAARYKSNPMHKHFVWDDTEAARRYREAQASALIRTIKIEIITPPRKTVTVRAFVNVREPGKDGTFSMRERGIYVPLQTALGNEIYKEQMMADAMRDMKAFRAKYSVLEKLTNVIEAMDEHLEDFFG